VKAMEAPKEVTTKALLECAEWLSACIKLGWSKSSLDFLQSLWWEYHDAKGRLVCDSEIVVTDK
jgi:hypothetical protein